MRISNFVKQDRLWGRLTDLAKIGATAKGGVNRQALTAEDGAARRLLADWALSRGFSIFQDDIGNLFVRRNGSEDSLPPVTTGSHLDTQPTGGRFDGAYGVMAGLEALEALEDSGIRTRHPVEVVAWTNEEGARFPPSCMGSGVYTGRYTLDWALSVQDPAGTSVGEALTAVMEQTKDAAPRGFGAPMAAYIEAHIEQGPILVSAGETIGVVTSVQSQNLFEVEVFGEEAHAGTTPRANRSDAVLAAVEIVAELERAAQDEADAMRFTVGRFIAKPGAPNTVPSHVVFTIDLRHPENSEIERMSNLIECLPGEVSARRRCRAKVTRLSDSPVTPFSDDIVGLIDSKRRDLELPGRRMPSGAGHDAMYIPPLAPTGMIFVPCVDGISHNEAEDALPHDLADGTRVLVDCLAELAGREG
ncbi:M20 family metallo-hydrolase [Hwanghaeella sp.]|uniref:M20 family metallo-hydrolase n=1 Tax=Hwanghaeella sp. TaxID=2605943 RepID=UPI003CCB9569